MPVTGLDHVNIRTTDIAASARFYVDVLGFKFTERPLVMGQQAAWLCDGGGNPIIHLRMLAPDGAATGAIDHVALACTDRPAVAARLEAHGVDFSMAENIIPGVAHIFLTDPHGIALELNFVEA